MAIGVFCMCGGCERCLADQGFQPEDFMSDEDKFDPDEMPAPVEEERFVVDLPEYGPPEFVPMRVVDPKDDMLRWSVVCRPTGRFVRYFVSRSDLARMKEHLDRLEQEFKKPR